MNIEIGTSENRLVVRGYDEIGVQVVGFSAQDCLQRLSSDPSFATELDSKRLAWEKQVVTFDILPKMRPFTVPKEYVFEIVRFQPGVCTTNLPSKQNNDAIDLSFSEVGCLEKLDKMAQWYKKSKDNCFRSNILGKISLALDQFPTLKRSPQTILHLEGIPLPFSLFQTCVLGARDTLSAEDYVDFLIQVQNTVPEASDENIKVFLQSEVACALDFALPTGPTTRALQYPSKQGVDDWPNQEGPETPSTKMHRTLHISSPPPGAPKAQGRRLKPADLTRRLEAEESELDGSDLQIPVPKIPRVDQGPEVTDKVSNKKDRA